MAKTIRAYNGSITVASGEGTLTITDDVFRTISDAGGFLKQILLKAPSDNDEFTLEIEDSDGFIVFDRIGAKGKINDVPNIPMRGDFDFNIKDATSDGSYSIKIIFLESW